MRRLSLLYYAVVHACKRRLGFKLEPKLDRFWRRQPCLDRCVLGVAAAGEGVEGGSNVGSVFTITD